MFGALVGELLLNGSRKSSGLTFDVAEQMKIDYANGKLHPGRYGEYHLILPMTAGYGLVGVELSLSEFAETDLLPSPDFPCGGGSALPGIRESLLFQNGLRRCLRPPATGELPTAEDNARSRRYHRESDQSQDITPIGFGNIWHWTNFG